MQQNLIAIDHSQKAATAQVLPDANLLFSSKTALAGLYLENHHSPPHETPEHYPIQHVVAIQTQGVVQSERKLNGQFKNEYIVAGDICVVPAHTHHWIHSQGEQELILLSFAPAFINQVAQESGARERIEIVPHFAKSDPLIHQIGLALRKALQADSINNQVYVQSMGITLAAHLIEYYSAEKQSLPIINSALCPNIGQAIDYIHSHLTQDLSLEAIATTIGMSQYHFSRVFKQTTGITLWQYVVQQRIQLAKRLLKKVDLSIVDVSKYLGFSSQGQFTNFFRKHSGVTPTQYRQKL
ncbi:MAG: helix-turn-helix domain-containing protein [Gloeocapsa sp. UFS-A4-WI-NPMV-4B04]|jgi:AraC family transcriptional regulator|nr:helix-turn-helix domain-containing protein [Gloeocapsa sp. UFS-A4-WI-NPMV-4B04]